MALLAADSVWFTLSLLLPDRLPWVTRQPVGKNYSRSWNNAVLS